MKKVYVTVMSFRNYKVFLMLAIIVLAASLVAGCAAGKYTGGGFMRSAAGGNQKATFGFNLAGIDRDNDGLVDIDSACDPDDNCSIWGVGKGQLAYNDHGAGVSFHFDCDLTTGSDIFDENACGMDIRIDPSFDCGGNPCITAMQWVGPYSSRAGNGTVIVAVTATGDSLNDQPWSLGGQGDTIEVTLVGGPHDGYHNIGTIDGGNIQWHQAR